MRAPLLGLGLGLLGLLPHAAHALQILLPVLSVTDLVAPERITAGVPFEVRFTLQNTGTAVAEGTRTCVWGVQDGTTVLLDLHADAPVAPSGALPVTLAVTWPLTTAGGAIIRVQPDCGDVRGTGVPANGLEVGVVIEVSLRLLTVRLPDADVSAAYDATLRVVGGAPPYTFEVEGLPAGLSATASGRITGTPAAAAAHVLLVRVRDTATVSSSAAVSLRVRDDGALRPAAAQPTLPSGTVGQPYCIDTPVQPLGLDASTTWSWRSDPPPGLYLAEAGGLCGVPSEAGTTTMTVVGIGADGGATSYAIPLVIAAQAVDVALPPCCKEVEAEGCAAVAPSSTALEAVVALGLALTLRRRREQRTASRAHTC